jgi:hypothetical protein
VGVHTWEIREVHVGEQRGVQRVSLREAALLLGISKDAVRQRIRRGTMRSEKGEDGRVYVFVDETVYASTDSVHGLQVGEDPRDLLIAQLQSEVEAWREESRRKDHIIAGLVERIPPQLEPPPAERESPESSAEEPVEPTPSEPGRGPMAEGTERVPWWRRMFGG